jgi:hypothetical protein
MGKHNHNKDKVKELHREDRGREGGREGGRGADFCMVCRRLMK